MNGSQITRILKSDLFTKPIFRGVFACDMLPKGYVTYPSAFVCNTDPHTEPGQHWVVIYLDANGRGEYFDSYGLAPDDAILMKLAQRHLKVFLDKHAIQWTHNTIALQNPLTAVCGQYCIFYLLHRCRGCSMNSIVQMFGPDKTDNDVLVHDYIEDYYDFNQLPLVSEEAINQIAKAMY